MTEEKFNEVYEKTKGLVAFKISQITSEHHTVQDIAQKVYVQLFNKCPDNWEIEQYIGWLKVTSKNTALKYIKYITCSKRDVILCPPVYDKQSECSNCDKLYKAILHYPDSSQERNLNQGFIEERVSLVKKIIKELPEKQRQAMELVYLQGLRVKDAAVVMKSNENCLGFLLNRGRNKIKEKIKYVQNIF